MTTMTTTITVHDESQAITGQGNIGMHPDYIISIQECCARPPPQPLSNRQNHICTFLFLRKNLINPIDNINKVSSSNQPPPLPLRR